MVAGLKLVPDCVLRTTEGLLGISWNHRRTDGMDLYFVANTTKATATGTLELRVQGRQPELECPHRRADTAILSSPRRRRA